MQQTKHFDYMEEAHVTCSDKFYGDRVPLYHFANVVKDAIEALNKLDAIKKALFYGREIEIPAKANPVPDLSNAPTWIADSTEEEGNAINVIHAIIGKATEAGELLEALSNCIVEGEVFDPVNAIEEVGDGFWYDAVLLKALKSSFGEAQVINIQKLRARFPNAFTEFDANNRDLFEERKILSNGVDTAE